jgi:hypothetical protein
MTKENIVNIIDILFTKDYNEKSYDKVPVWFELIVNYYSNRASILSILRSVGYEVPNWADSVMLPSDWSKEYLDLFFDNISKHYVCNGCIYSDNIGFWYGEHRSSLIDIPKMITHSSYSEIPWQFVLRNPLLNSKEYVLKMAQAINKGSHGEYFSKVTEFQKLNQDNLEEFINNINIKYSKLSDIPSVIINNISLISDHNKLDKIYNLFVRNSYETSYNADKYLKQFPKDYSIRFIKGKHEGSEKYLKSSKNLTKEEKVELLSLFVN